MIACNRLILVTMAVMAVAASSLVGCNLVEMESRKLTQAISEMEEAFPMKMEHIFWSNKRTAEILMAHNELEGKELLETVQVAAFIESAKYAIRHQTLSVIRDKINERFIEDGLVLLDTKHKINMRPQMLSALVARVTMRAYADSDRFTAIYWGWLHKLIEHNMVAYANNKVFKQLAIDAYQQMLQLDIDMKTANQEFERVLASSLQAMDIDQLQSRYIVDLLDHMIEEMLECRTCASAKPDEARFNTRPMFDGEAAVEKAFYEHVDPKIPNAIVDIDGVFEVKPEEQKRVTRKDIDDLMQKLIESL